MGFSRVAGTVSASKGEGVIGPGPTLALPTGVGGNTDPEVWATDTVEGAGNDGIGISTLGALATVVAGSGTASTGCTEAVFTSGTLGTGSPLGVDEGTVKACTGCTIEGTGCTAAALGTGSPPGVIAGVPDARLRLWAQAHHQA